MFMREREGGEREWGVVPAQEIGASVEGKKAHHRHFLSFFMSQGGARVSSYSPFLSRGTPQLKIQREGAAGERRSRSTIPLFPFFTPQLELANYLWIAQVDRLP